MKKTDIRLIERQVQQLDILTPSMPSNEDVFRYLVRLPYLWTPQEYLYIQHFHKVYGNDPSVMHGGLVKYGEKINTIAV